MKPMNLAVAAGMCSLLCLSSIARAEGDEAKPGDGMKRLGDAAEKKMGKMGDKMDEMAGKVADKMGEKKGEKGMTPEEMAAMAPKPSPEHAHIKKLAGNWTFENTMTMPGMPNETTKGTAEGTMIGEFWCRTQIHSEMMGQPFEGVSTDGYDPFKKSYVSSWVDSMCPEMVVSDVKMDGNKSTSKFSFHDPMSKQVVTQTLVDEWVDDNHHTMSFSMPGPDGKDMTIMVMKYTRQ